MALQYNILNNKDKYTSKYLSEQIYNLLTKTFIIPKNFSYIIYKVTKAYIGRPDLISLDAYGTQNYADIICKLNGISDPFTLNKDQYLIIPSVESIENFINTSTSEITMFNDSTDDISYSPSVKTTTDKRKANEAILGDTRFIIDKEKGLIIY